MALAAANPEPSTLGNSLGKANVLKTGTLVTTTVAADQVVLTYTVTAGKTLYLQYAFIEGSLTVPGASNNAALGTISVETPSGTKVISKRCAVGSSVPFPQFELPFSEPVPIAAGTVIRVVVTPLVTTSCTWAANFGGYEK